MSMEHGAVGWSEARLFDVGGRRMALYEAGQGTPAVVLEMGLGMGGGYFEDIARSVSAFARVVWYDRAGLGQSDPEPKPRTIADLAGDLHKLLHAAQIPVPYVLAGHSMGGITARFYQRRYPAEVAALVLIDSAHEAQRERFLAVLPPETPGEPPAVAQYRAALRSAWADPMANSEGIDNIANTVLMGHRADLGDLPLVVLSRGRGQASDGFPTALAEEKERAWREMQCELASLSSRSAHLIAERSGHLINQDEPEMVVEAIRQALALAQERAGR
jgi:pimeloyl-ACP methyl ester carboxylesterase